MKKILMWIGISLGLFVVLVGVVFAVLSFLNPVETDRAEQPLSMASIGAGASAPSTSGDSAALVTATTIREGSLAESPVVHLQSQVDSLRSQLFFSKLVTDSLNEELSVKNSAVEGLQKRIDDLNREILSANRRDISIKELAKTYETMKPEEMRSILSKVDDETVISIYRNMNSRMRKNLFIALSEDRAAVITQRLASSSE